VAEVPEHVTADLQAALEAEREVAERLREVRRQVADAVAANVAAGVPYHQLARLTLKARIGRSPTIAERKREAGRLRQLMFRRRVIGCNGDQFAGPGALADMLSPSQLEGDSTTMINANPRLISRKVIEETFALDDDGLAHGRGSDLEDADDEDEEEDVGQKPRKR
jgi:hypothetical protein